MSITKILIVDDAAADRANLLKIVTDAGFVASTAASGREGLQKALTERPDLIFLDILMDDLDGYQICRGVRANEATRATPIVIVSSKAQRADRVWALEQGASAYLTKPYRSQDILDQIKRLQ
jgi:twitching motility two-component system response regulator PilH